MIFFTIFSINQTVRSTQYIDYPIQNWQFSEQKFSKICIYKGYQELEQKSPGSVGYIDCRARGGGWAGGLFPLHPMGVLRGWVGGIISTQIIDCETDGGKW